MDLGEDASREGSGEPSGEGRWLTYDELGRIRGIGRESAVKLAQRKRWRRIPGNDGVARVYVPPEWLTPAKEPSGERSPHPSPDIPPAIGALEAAIAGLVTRAERAEAEVDRTLADLQAERSRADRAEQDREAERSRAERAEQARDGERARADALRERIDALQAEAANLRATLDTAETEGAAADVQVAELTAQLREARATAQAAQEKAEEAQRADDARRFRGTWARLRAAWRGE